MTGGLEVRKQAAGGVERSSEPRQFHPDVRNSSGSDANLAAIGSGKEAGTGDRDRLPGQNFP